MADSTRTPLVVSCPYQLCSQVPMPMLGCTHYKGQSGMTPATLVDQVMSGLKRVLPLLKPDGKGFKLEYHGKEFDCTVSESHSSEQLQETNIHDKIYPAGTLIKGKVAIEISRFKSVTHYDGRTGRYETHLPTKWNDRLMRRLQRELTDLLPQEIRCGIDVM